MADITTCGALRFEEAYMPRVWGGHKLASVYGKDIPPDTKIGEAWLISDHPQHESVLADGLLQGKTLRYLMQENSAYLLGTDAKPLRDGRFPLLLKIIDAAQDLSVQVHPDDVVAITLNENDGGKTELWHILHAEKGAKLYCGLHEKSGEVPLKTVFSPENIMAALKTFEAQAGDTVLVAAGTVHSIGAGVLLAEIQQNSDLTYRIFDWNRSGQDGIARALHLEKALSATHVKSQPIIHHADNSNPREVDILGTCVHFTAEQIMLSESGTFNTENKTPHIIFAPDSPIKIITHVNEIRLKPGEASLLPAGLREYTLRGSAAVLRFSCGHLGKRD